VCAANYKDKPLSKTMSGKTLVRLRGFYFKADWRRVVPTRRGRDDSQSRLSQGHCSWCLETYYPTAKSKDQKREGHPLEEI